MKNKNYIICLPVFKQGDDLHYYLEINNNDPVKGFSSLAEQYRSAAIICDNISVELAKIKDISSIEISACTHQIEIYSPPNLVKALLKKELLCEDNVS